MPTAQFASVAPRILMRRFFWWQQAAGAALWTALVGLAMGYHYLAERVRVLHAPFYATYRAAKLRELALDKAQTAGLLLAAGLALALLAGLLRRPLLLWLSGRIRTCAGLAAVALVVFGAELLLLALPPWPVAYQAFGWGSIGRQLRALVVLSLPWLLTEAVVWYRLGRALGYPVLRAPAKEIYQPGH